MPRAGKPDTRPQWERDDENADHKLTRGDRVLLTRGTRETLVSGAVAGLMIGAGPTVLVLLLRGVLGGGWSFDHWVKNLVIYSALALVLGPLLGALRRWSCRGHRFSHVPMAGVRAGWDTWLAIAAVDVLVVIYVMEDALGVLLLFTIWGLVWLGLLYYLVWLALQDLVLRQRWIGGRRQLHDPLSSVGAGQ